MTDRFNNFIPYLWQVEGTVFENDPDDPGGATKYGIDQASHPNVNIRNLTDQQARQIYWSEWQARGIEKMPPKVGEVYFDIVVNNGRGRADQIFAQSHDPVGMIEARDAFYRRLAERRPASRKYLKGWLHRGQILKRHLGI